MPARPSFYENVRLAIILVFVFAGVFSPQFAASAPTGAPVEIPAILPLSGPGASTGGPIQQALQALEREVNATGGIRDRPLRFVFSDDQTSPQVAVQLFDGAVARGAQAVIGGAYSATCKATAPLAQQKGPVFYCLSPALQPTRGGYVFSSYYYPLDLLEKTLAYFHQKGWNRVAFLISTDASGQEVDGRLDEILGLQKIRGLQVAAHEHFAPADVTLSAQVAHIAASKPQAIVIWAAGGIPAALRSLHDAGLDLPTAVTPSLQVYSAMTQFSAILPSRLYFGCGKWAQYPDIRPGPIKEALARYFATFKSAGVAPDTGAALAWDPGLILVSALRALGPDAGAAQIHAYIENLRGFAGTNGSYDFRSGDQRGLNEDDAIVTVWSPEKGTWVLAR